MLDVAVAYNRYSFLGHEFLTWLWYAIAVEQEQLQRIDRELASLEIGNRLVLQNHTQQTTETVSIRGDEAGMEEGLLALKKGALVTEINLVYRSGDHCWHFSVKGESLNLTGLKVPETSPLESAEDITGTVIEKAYLCQRPVLLLQTLYIHFIHIRLGSRWTGEIVPRMRAWINS